MNEKMKRKYGIIFGAVVIALLMISSATATTMPLLSKSTQESVVSENDVVLTINNLPELEKALDLLDNPNEQQALQEIIALIEDNGQITMGELYELAGLFNLGLTLSGEVSAGFPGRMVRFFGFFALPCSFELESGTVNGFNAPQQVSWGFFIGYWCLSDVVHSFNAFAVGMAFGLHIGASSITTTCSDTLASTMTSLSEQITITNSLTTISGTTYILSTSPTND